MVMIHQEVVLILRWPYFRARWPYVMGYTVVHAKPPSTLEICL